MACLQTPTSLLEPAANSGLLIRHRRSRSANSHALCESFVFRLSHVVTSRPDAKRLSPSLLAAKWRQFEEGSLIEGAAEHVRAGRQSLDDSRTALMAEDRAAGEFHTTHPTEHVRLLSRAERFGPSIHGVRHAASPYLVALP